MDEEWDGNHLHTSVHCLKSNSHSPLPKNTSSRTSTTVSHQQVVQLHSSREERGEVGRRRRGLGGGGGMEEEEEEEVEGCRSMKRSTGGVKERG